MRVFMLLFIMYFTFIASFGRLREVFCPLCFTFNLLAIFISPAISFDCLFVSSSIASLCPLRHLQSYNKLRERERKSRMKSRRLLPYLTSIYILTHFVFIRLVMFTFPSSSFHTIASAKPATTGSHISFCFVWA